MKKAIAGIAIGTLAALLVAFLPIEAVAIQIAQKVIEGATGIYATYQTSKSLYCLETVYKHKYLGISYAKKVNQKFYYDSELTAMVPGGEKTIYGFWS